ncbi:MAG: IS630 family transposase [Calothrix sp. CSU_2_0]|nr:IS630 family transposase [Calothrix sp. CSU_2_0]
MKVRFIKGLYIDTIKLLERIHKQSKYHHVRRRAKCIKLSYEGHKVNDLAKIFHVTRLTIINWLNDWDDFSLVGLYDEKGRGRKSKLNDEQKLQVKQWTKENSRNLHVVVKNVREEWGIYISKDTVKRIINFFNMSWHRITRRVSGEPDALEYKDKKAELETLKEQDDRGEINLVYVDESGFSLNSYVPYAWQEKGDEVVVECERSQRLNVFGFLNRKNDLETYLFECNINSDVVIACIDDFSKKQDKPTVLVIDNASIHTSNKFLNKQKEWSDKNLRIFFLPKYSPELNIIEILWRFIKYQWLEVDAYFSWENLVRSVEYVLLNFGEEYIINFA